MKHQKKNFSFSQLNATIETLRELDIQVHPNLLRRALQAGREEIQLAEYKLQRARDAYDGLSAIAGEISDSTPL